MLENWLTPVSEALCTLAEENEARMGAHLHIHADGIPDLKKVKLAVLGIGAEEADAVRERLYRLSWPHKHLEVADLGNARRQEPDFIAPLIMELLQSNICPLIIGREERLLQGQFAAHHGWQKSVSLALVDEKLALNPQNPADSSSYLNELLMSKKKLFHFTAVGLQAHFLDESVERYANERHFDRLHLGPLREDIHVSEPYIRDADLVAFNLSALKRIEAPGVLQASPAGLFSEEACQIARYAGVSDKLQSIGFYGYRNEADPAGHTAAVIAQLIWYFIGGFADRKNDFPVSMDGLMEYIIPIKKYDYQLTFWKSSKSGRWWLQVPVNIGKGQKRHRLIPCDYKDYLSASKGELPDRFLKAFRRFDP
ncbi:MAG: hypothetical protein CMN32_10685 [Saprospirales bacterium]|nr:hypothetical protein [Saprospirales bacterium]